MMCWEGAHAELNGILSLCALEVIVGFSLWVGGIQLPNSTFLISVACSDVMGRLSSETVRDLGNLEK